MSESLKLSLLSLLKKAIENEEKELISIPDDHPVMRAHKELFEKLNEPVEELNHPLAKKFKESNIHEIGTKITLDLSNKLLPRAYKMYYEIKKASRTPEKVDEHFSDLYHHALGAHGLMENLKAHFSLAFKGHIDYDITKEMVDEMKEVHQEITKSMSETLHKMGVHDEEKKRKIIDELISTDMEKGLRQAHEMLGGYVKEEINKRSLPFLREEEKDFNA